MRKLVAIFTIAVFVAVMSLTGCTGLNSTATGNLFAPIPSATYQSNVSPLITVVSIVYGQKLTPQQQQIFNGIIANLNQQAASQPSVDILPAIFATATQIYLDKGAANTAKITPQQAVLALAGLEIVKTAYVNGTTKSDVRETLYPILKNVLQAKAGVSDIPTTGTLTTK